AHAERVRTLRDFEGGEGVDMDIGCGILDRTANIEIGRTRVFRMDATLHADLARPARPRLARAAFDLLECQVIGPAAQVLAQLALREGAELAAEIADVRVVDVPVDDVAHA